MMTAFTSIYPAHVVKSQSVIHTSKGVGTNLKVEGLKP